MASLGFTARLPVSTSRLLADIGLAALSVRTAPSTPGARPGVGVLYVAEYR